MTNRNHLKSISVVITMTLFFCIPHQAVDAYCSASGGCDEYIYGVEVGTINNTGTICSSYANYTSSFSTIMEAGTGYSILVTTRVPGYPPGSGYNGDQCGIWVDWNRDGDFDDTDETVYGAQGGGFFSTTITLPAHALPGNTRMRIRLRWEGALNPCGATPYGEVEDYGITLVSENMGRITGLKFHDVDGNGTHDGGEPNLPDWKIYLDLNDNGQFDVDEPNQLTDPNGCYDFNYLPLGSYTVAEELQEGWVQTFPGGAGTHTVVLDSNTPVECDFGNAQSLPGNIHGTKFHDLNGNGICEAGEGALEGWEIYLDLNDNGQWDSGEPKGLTDSDGHYEFSDLSPGSYTVTEVGRCGWRQTTPRMSLYDEFAISGLRDLVFDDLRQLLYICTRDGSVERYDLKAKSLLSPYNAGTTLNSVDITPDCNWLYVTEEQTVGGQGFLHKVNLNSGSVSDIPYTLASGEGGSWDINIGSHGKGLMTTRFLGSGSVPLRELDCATDTFTVRTGLPYYDPFVKDSIYGDSRLFRGADRSLIYIVEGSASSGYMATYDCPTGTFPHWREVGTYIDNIPHGVNRNASLIAYQTYTSTIKIMNSALTVIKTLGNEDGGFGFDPVRDILYVADSDLDQLIALHTQSWNELYRANTGSISRFRYNFFEVVGSMAFSNQGRFLALTTDSGVKIFQIEGQTVTWQAGEAIQVDFGNQANITGDFDGDLDIDMNDLALLFENWLLNEPCIDIAPFGGDGIINLYDFSALSAHWLAGVNP